MKWSRGMCHDSVCAIMNQGKFDKLRERIQGLYGADRPRDTLIALAKAVGRHKKKRRGPHTMWVRDASPALQPLPIPNSPTIKRYTAESILEQLERDTLAWDDFLRQPRRNAHAKTR